MPDDDDVTEPPPGFWGEGEDNEPVDPDDPRTVPLAAEPYDDDPDGPDDYDDDYEDDRPSRRTAVLVAVGALLFVLAGVAIAAALVASDDDDDPIASVSSTSTSTTRSTAPTISGLPGLGGSSTSSSTSTTKPGSSSTSSSTSSSSTTSTTEAADGPACSPTGSSAAAADNKPMKVAFCVDDPTPKVGQSVTLSGTAEDLDGGVTLDCVRVSWEGEQFGECFPPQADPPASINESYTFKHAFAKAGTYTIHVGARSGKPKDSFAETTLKITVHA